MKIYQIFFSRMFEYQLAFVSRLSKKKNKIWIWKSSPVLIPPILDRENRRLPLLVCLNGDV